MQIVSNCPLCEQHSLHIIGQEEAQMLQCLHCGYKANLAALCFHHEDEDSKEAGPATLVAKRSPLPNDEYWELYKYEFEKCITLCFNCHIAHHQPEYNNQTVNF